jgi:hypothetical protein
MPTQAKEVFHGFAKDEFYLVRGGTPVSLEAFAVNPRKYIRSETAYIALLRHVGGILGTELNDEQFRELMAQARLVPCVGPIRTDGITNGGTIRSSERQCYGTKEYLIQVPINGGWVTVASQACLNPVYGFAPPPPPLPPPPPVVAAAPMIVVPASIDYSIRGSTTTFSLPGIFLPGTLVQIGCAECCIEYVSVPALFLSGQPVQSNTGD